MACFVVIPPLPLHIHCYVKSSTVPWAPFLTIHPAAFFVTCPGSHLLVGDRDEALFGEFPQGADVCPHVQLTAHQHHFGIGTKLLRLSLPLWKHEPPERHRNTL